MREIVPGVRGLAVWRALPAPCWSWNEPTPWKWPKARHQGAIFPDAKAADLERAYEGMSVDPPQAIIVFPDPITVVNHQEIIEFAGSLRVPVISGWADFADAGGSVSYGPRLAKSYRRLRLRHRPRAERE